MWKYRQINWQEWHKRQSHQTHLKTYILPKRNKVNYHGCSNSKASVNLLLRNNFNATSHSSRPLLRSNLVDADLKIKKIIYRISIAFTISKLSQGVCVCVCAHILWKHSWAVLLTLPRISSVRNLWELTSFSVRWEHPHLLHGAIVSVEQMMRNARGGRWINDSHPLLHPSITPRTTDIGTTLTHGGAGAILFYFDYIRGKCALVENWIV